MTSRQIATWFCVAVVGAKGDEQLRLADALGKALEPLTDNERMNFYGNVFNVPDCPKAAPILNVSNGNRPIDNALNFVTAKDTCER